MLRDRLSWLRFAGFDPGSDPGFDPGAPTPDQNTIRHIRNRLGETGTLGRMMNAYDWQRQKQGSVPMAGPIDDTPLVPVHQILVENGRRTEPMGPRRKS